MIRDTSAQDRPLEKPPLHRRRGLLIVSIVAAAALIALAAPSIQRAFSASTSISASRLSFGKVEVGPFVRDVAGEGKVVAANSPTIYAPSNGALQMLVKAGEQVKKGQVLAHLDSPDLMAKLAQERSNADAMKADVMRAFSSVSRAWSTCMPATAPALKACVWRSRSVCAALKSMLAFS